MQLTRYHAPRDDRVLDLIKRVSSRIAAEKPMAPGTNKRLYEILSHLPDEVVSAIANEEEPHFLHLRDHMPESFSQHGRDYIRVSHGKIPIVWADELKYGTDKEGLVRHEELIDRSGIGEWYLKLRLEGGLVLPSRSELEHLIGQGVRDCDLFYLGGRYGAYDNASSNLMLLYSALSANGAMHNVLDTSTDFLEKRAYEVVNGFGNCVAQKAVMGIVSEVIPQVLSKLREGNLGGIHLVPRPPGGHGDPRLN
jgi:hypothetical protein